MEASGSGGEAARPWTAISTWAPAGGATVEDAVSFETSDEDAEESPAGVVLTRPAADEDSDAPPCEVTGRRTPRLVLAWSKFSANHLLALAGSLIGCRCECSYEFLCCFIHHISEQNPARRVLANQTDLFCLPVWVLNLAL
jgi:hypothetical protein